jgi:uncharacterized protein
VTSSRADHQRVTELLGREPRGRYEIVVRADNGDPIVLRNAPLLDDGTPMPTLYWLIGTDDVRRVGQLEAAGGVNAAEAAIDPIDLVAAHARYAAERDAEIAPDHDGPRPTGGVGGTRVGVKCLHAHWAWFLAGGDDPVGRWIEQRLADQVSPFDGVVAIGDERTLVTVGSITHEIPWGALNLTDRWLRDDDPPRPEALTNALGTVDDDLDDLLRLHPEVTGIEEWVLSGPTVHSLACLEAGEILGPGWHEYPRSTAEEVFRLVATESMHDRAQNPGLPSAHVEVIVGTSCIIQALMRRFHLDMVTLQTSD